MARILRVLKRIFFTLLLRCDRRSRVLCALPPAHAASSGTAACPRRSQHCRGAWPFRLLDRNGRSFSHFFIGVTAGSMLVRHPAADLFIDTGNSSYFETSHARSGSFTLGTVWTTSAASKTAWGKPLLLRDSDDDPVLANRIVSKRQPTPRNGTGPGDHVRPRPQRQ